MFLSMPTSFVTLKTAAKLNPDSRPPYVVEMHRISPQHMVVFLSLEIVLFSQGMKNPPVFEPGIYASICGARLPARTWATRLVQHGVFFTCSLIKKRPLSWKFTSLYHGRGLKVDRQTDVFRKSVAWAASFCSAGCLHRFVRAGLQECKHFIIFYLGCLTFGKNGV